MSKIQHDKYWLNRHDAIYIQYVDYMVRTIGKDAKSLIDVGSKKCGYMEWWEWIPRKVSIDLLNPYSSDKVLGIRGDFFTTPLAGPYDICLCLQVLEHIEDARSFAQKLLETAPQLIVSVPYKWKKGWVDFHPQDPVDEEKMFSWFDREPNWRWEVREPFARSSRIVCWYDREDPKRKIDNLGIKERLPKPERML